MKIMLRSYTAILNKHFNSKYKLILKIAYFYSILYKIAI